MTRIKFYVYLIITLHSGITFCSNFSFINLPENHLSYYFHNFPSIAEECLSDEECPYRDFLKSEKYKNEACWGYETGCHRNNSFSYPKCPGEHTGWALSKEGQLETFYHQADFGYVKDQLQEMSLMCEPKFKEDSSLECSRYLRFCRGRNLMLNFTDLSQVKEPLRYNMNVLKEGEITGYCKLHADRLKTEIDHLSALQSWSPELRYFTKSEKRPIESRQCDIVINKPTFIMKIDATSNMYHHFCDFFNLYASLHVNLTHPQTFSTDVHILVWESYTYDSAFAETFKAFTDYPIWDLKTFRGGTVCFKNLVLPLLPRMIFGLYYNTPIVYGCEKSGLFQAFAEHILHRLQIPQYTRASRKVRITFLVRRTKYRQIINEDELLEAISYEDDYIIRRVAFGRSIPFKDQLEVSRNTDVLIGIHGAGLTHLLFLPNWASVFELYNCEDPNCYKDLARLRGVNYVTWEDTALLASHDSEDAPERGAHAKFVNYTFDKTEFRRIVRKAADHVLHHEEFQRFLKSQGLHDEL